MATVPQSRELRIEPVETTRTFETVISHIIDAVECAQLGKGNPLPSEAEFAAALRVSKPTLRQALRVLERAGMVEVRRGAGIMLTTDLLPVELIGKYVALEEDQVVDVLLARRVLETKVTHLAVRRASSDDFAAMERAIHLLEQHIGDRSMVMRADASFHRAINRACHSRALRVAMQTLASEIEPVRDAYRGGDQYDALTLNVHRRQLEAMRTQDYAALTNLLDRHFRLLEESFAIAIGYSWEELFAEPVAETAGGLA